MEVKDRKRIFARKNKKIYSIELLLLLFFLLFDYRLIIHLMDENDNYPIIDFYPNDIQIDSNTVKSFSK